jgi:hypothetical protein
VDPVVLVVGEAQLGVRLEAVWTAARDLDRVDRVEGMGGIAGGDGIDRVAGRDIGGRLGSRAVVNRLDNVTGAGRLGGAGRVGRGEVARVLVGHDVVTSRSAIQAPIEEKKPSPSVVGPVSVSTACSGCGISPTTLPASLQMPAMSCSEPLGLTST